MTRLLDLGERVEKAAGPDAKIDKAIKEAVGDAWDYAADWGPRENYQPVAKPYTASLDAAMTLVPEGHDGEGAAVVSPLKRINLPRTFAATPALALCAAALRARAAMSEVGLHDSGETG